MMKRKEDNCTLCRWPAQMVDILLSLGLEFAKLDFELTPHENSKAKIKGLESRQQTLSSHFGKN